jgi:phosphoglycerate dehydrogenase-like enzyme/predicted dehydrogenase
VVGASETAALLHLPVLAALRDAGRIDLVEIADVRSAAAADLRQRFGFARDSGDAMSAIAQPDVDVVYVIGSANLHYELGLAALEAGKHLFVEKPVAPTYAQACALAAKATAQNLIAVGGHNRRFSAGLERIRAQAGRAGWSLGEAVFHKPEFGRPPAFGARSWLTGNGIHALDALVFMMGGLPEHLTAQTGGSGVANSNFSALMRWPNGAQGVFLCNNEAGVRREEYSFHAPGQSWKLTEDELEIEDSFAAEHDAFLSAVTGGRPAAHAISELAPSLFLAELIEAGHCGPVPNILKSSATVAPPTKLRGTLLLVGAERLRPALDLLPSGISAIAVSELERSSDTRPDVIAALVAPGAAPLCDALLDRLPNLVIVGVVGLSLQRYAPAQLLARGIAVVNASTAYAESVAEFALGLAILGRRGAFRSGEAMRRGGWRNAPPPFNLQGMALVLARLFRPIARRLGLEGRFLRVWRSSPRLAALSASDQATTRRDLAGARVGLVGWGANARAFARRLVQCGARVLVFSEHADPDDVRAAGAEPVDPSAALAADVVSLHRGLTAETRHCIGTTELARLRPGAVLINVARGALIEPEALVARLRRGDVFACLDTFDQEPLPRRHPLRKLRNVFLTPHIAGGSPEMFAAAAREVIGKLTSFIEGADVDAVTAERLATMT